MLRWLRRRSSPSGHDTEHDAFRLRERRPDHEHVLPGSRETRLGRPIALNGSGRWGEDSVTNRVVRIRSTKESLPAIAETRAGAASRLLPAAQASYRRTGSPAEHVGTQSPAAAPSTSLSRRIQDARWHPRRRRPSGCNRSAAVETSSTRLHVQGEYRGLSKRSELGNESCKCSAGPIRNAEQEAEPSAGICAKQNRARKSRTSHSDPWAID